MYNHAPKDYHCPFYRLVEQIHQEDVDRTVYHDDFITALIPLHKWPNNAGHVLVVPNLHYENIYDLPSALSARIHDCARAVALALKSVYCCDRVSTRQHNEPAGNQDVWHFHVHVFPRYEGDQLYVSDRQPMTAAERNRYARMLRPAMQHWKPTIDCWLATSSAAFATHIKEEYYSLCSLRASKSWSRNMSNGRASFSPAFARWAGVVSLMGIAMVFLARWVRPLPENAHPALVFVIGVLPNLGAGLALPFAGVLWIGGVFQAKRWEPAVVFYGMVGVTLIGLVGWECIQLWVWEYPFDVYDLAATVLGVAVAVLVHRLIAARSPLMELVE